ncbi:MAG: VanZ family protein [bacterium]
MINQNNQKLETYAFKDNAFDNIWKSIFFISFGLVLIATLYPFNFVIDQKSEQQGLELFILGWGESSLVDVNNNILLFLPLGFTVAGVFSRKRMTRGFITCLILMVSFVLSYTIETTQIFLPSRSPSLFDVFANCTGSMLGTILFSLIKA